MRGFRGALLAVLILALVAAGAPVMAAHGQGAAPAAAEGQPAASAGAAAGTPAPATAASATAPAPAAPPAGAVPPAPAAPGAEQLPPGMTRYYMVFLRRSGKPKPPDLDRIMEGHMANIRRLAAEKKLLLAGPFMDQSGTGSLAGVFIFAAGSLDEARRWTETDPAVVAGRFTFEVVPWLGPKTLSRVLEP